MSVVAKFREKLTNAFTAATRGVHPDGTVIKSEEEQQEVILKEIGEAAALLDESPVSKETPVPQTPEEIRKSLSPEALALVEKAEQDAAEAQQAATVAKAELAKAQEAQAETARVAKAKEMLGTLAGDPAIMAGILKSLDEPQAAELERVLKGAQKRSEGETDPTVQIGKDGAPGTGLTDLQKLNARAEEIMKESGCARPTAIAKALDENPSLYEASLTPATKE